MKHVEKIVILFALLVLVLSAILLFRLSILVPFSRSETRDGSLLLIEARVVEQIWVGSNRRGGPAAISRVPVHLRFLANSGAPVAVYLPWATNGEFSAVFVPHVLKDNVYELTDLWLESSGYGMRNGSVIDGGGTPQPVEIGKWSVNHCLGHGEPAPEPRYEEAKIEVRVQPARDVKREVGTGTLSGERLHITQVAVPQRMTFGVSEYQLQQQDASDSPEIPK